MRPGPGQTPHDRDELFAAQALHDRSSDQSNGADHRSMH
jgi:hypothetical protein